MAQIKSALEIALEKTADIKSDANAGMARELANAGKKAASAFMEDGEESLFKKNISGTTDGHRYSKEELKEVTTGAVNLLTTRVQLPSAEEDIETIMRAGKGLEVLLSNKEMKQLFETVQTVCMQYMSSRSQLEQALAQQYAPKLHKKEMELAKRTGQEIHLTPKQDPEFTQLFDRNMKQLKNQYSGAFGEVQDRIYSMAGMESSEKK